MASFGYYALTFLESIPAIVGIRGTYEQPRYTVLDTLGPKTEVRRYEPRMAAEAPMARPSKDGPSSPDGQGRSNLAGQRQAFESLFRYITGANHAGASLAMTTPVERSGTEIAMTAPVATEAGAMRFFLPSAIAAGGAPEPDDPAVRIVAVPARTLAAIRFSGTSDAASILANTRVLRARLAASPWREAGPPLTFNYDPPFTLPPLRRNEVLIPVEQAPAAKIP